MTCRHGFIGPCAECDGAGQDPPREEDEPQELEGPDDDELTDREAEALERGGDTLEEDAANDREPRLTAQATCPKCGGELEWSRYCGARVCCACDHHLGLVRCYCGWAASGGNGRAELEEMGEVIEEEA